MAEQKAGQQAAPQAPTPIVKPETSLALMKRTVVDAVAAKVETFVKNREIDLPAAYSVGNAIKSAWLVLQDTKDKNGKPALEVCTKDSIANALLDTIVQGLSPMKDQVYYIVYGNTLAAQRSYFGSMALARMVQPVIDDFSYAVVYEDDKFKYGITNGKKSIILHEQEFGSVDKKKIAGAYAIALLKDGSPYRSEIMTMAEITQAWRQSKMHPVNDNGTIKADSVQGKFTADMATKTVVNKLCKQIVNASSDKALLLERMNRAEDISDRVSAEAEIEEQANAGEIVDITETDAKQIEETRKDDLMETAPGPCPDKPDITYLKSHCDKCTKRQGCPAWDEPKEAKKGGPGF